MDAFGGQSQREWVIYTGWAKAATAHGFAAVNADTHTDGVADDFDALATFLRQHASELKIDPGRIAVYAASGNAYRGLPIIEDPKRNWIKAAAIYYGAADIEQFRPEVPLLWIRAGLDRPQMNRQIDEAASKAIHQNVTVAVVNFAGGHHGFEVIDDNDAGRDVIEQTFQFFKKSLDPAWRAAFASGQRQAEAAGAVSLGDYERAASIYGQLIDENSSAMLHPAYGEALLGAKRYRDARVQFDRAERLGGLGPRDLGVPAAMASALDGDGDAAIAWLKTIPKQFLPANLQQDAAFEKLRTRPDFQAIFRN
jgi:dienelactone hydrolase